MDKLFSNSVFSFCLCSSADIRPVVSQYFERADSIGKYFVFTDNNTPMEHGSLDGRELILFGYAVDVFNGQSGNLCQTILSSTESLSEVIDFEKRLGGKYVVFYSENGKCFCIGDATTSIPTFYSTETADFICCSNPKLITETLSLSPDAELLKIRKSGKLNQAMPFDVTIYKEMKQLIPNHYIDFEQQKAVRFINASDKQKEISPEEAAKITSPMIEKLANLYTSKFKVYCPLTAGRDSRVVFAFLKNAPAYTVWQERFEHDDQDWMIPEKLTALSNEPYEKIYHEDITEKDRAEMDKFLGKNGYSDEAFRLALTIRRHYGDGAVIEGDIIGQVGKCSLHRDIPSFLATPGYFRCKLHNYSGESKKLLGEWLKEIKNADEKINTFDLFSVENRMGRWAAQTHIIHNAMGQLYLNIFNSRSIIYTWTAVDRSKRKMSEIHIALINKKFPELLSIPFEQDNSRFISLAKTNGITYYLASYAKYYIEREKFKNTMRLAEE